MTTNSNNLLIAVASSNINKQISIDEAVAISKSYTDSHLVSNGSGVPYTGATSDLNLGTHNLLLNKIVLDGSLILSLGAPPVLPIENKVQMYADYGSTKDTVIPLMTAIDAPSGLASANSSWGVTPPFHAFTNNGTGWINNGDGFPTFIQYKFDIEKIINSYSILPFDDSNFPGRCPKSWIFQASIDGITWVDLNVNSNVIDWVIGTKKVFNINNNSINYLYYRLYITENVGDTYTAVNKLELYESNISLWVLDSKGKKLQLGL